MVFQADYQHMIDVMENKRPARLPLYEHIISPQIMEEILGVQFADLIEGNQSDIEEFFSYYCRFFQEMTYDTVSFEEGLAPLLPGHGAIMGGMPGPIQNRDDFEKYPWDEIPERYWARADKRFQALSEALPPGMKALGGVGFGVFEISEDLVGFQQLAYLQVDDPDLHAELYVKIGDLMTTIWSRFLERSADDFAICRMGDDLGFKTNTLISPKTIRQHVFPQYKRIISLIKGAGKPFLWHSCGKIFAIMDDAIALGINAKHSNEDVIAPYDKWISLYSDRIGLLGGIDVDTLCTRPATQIFDEIVEKGQRFRANANGYALGSGNSIPEYVPVEGYLAMIDAAKAIRESEQR